MDEGGSPLAYATKSAQRARQKRRITMPEYVAGLCRMQDGELVPFDTKRFFADNHDEAVRQAVEWLSSTDVAIDDSTWLQVLCNGSAFFSKEIGQL
jgi:hypothetical protein